MTYLYRPNLFDSGKPDAALATAPRTTRNWRAALRGMWGAPMPEAFADGQNGASSNGSSSNGLSSNGGSSHGGSSNDSSSGKGCGGAGVAPALAVTPIAPGLVDDGMTPMRQSPHDRGWGEHADQMRDALEAWRTNPLARRLVSLITSTCVGDGIRLTSPYAPLEHFLRAFWSHPQNHIDDELPEWCDELSRSGELFLVLFPDTLTGMSVVRAIPAAQIDEIQWEEGDYRTELAYRDVGLGIGNVRWWKSAAHPDLRPHEPILLHFAVNRPVGALRGESDLASVLPWLRRYARWLEDRVRLNASVRSFLWVVNAPRAARNKLSEYYRQPPEAGSVILADEAEKWSAVTPNLHANDAEKDGRAIRWMIAAGGPGTALIDLGEGEDANLATGSVMQEQKRRFLRRRQRMLVQMLQEVALHAFRRYVEVTALSARRVSAEDIVALAPDISPEDNASLAQAAAQIVQALQGMGEIAGMSEEYRRMALRLFAKFAGESISGADLERLLSKS